MLTIEQASEMLAVSAKTVRRWIQAGKLPAVKLGRQWRLELESGRGRLVGLRLYTLITGADPRQLEFGFALWTRDMVRTLIRREFTVSLSAVSVGRLLRTLGLSPQRPLWRAWQADPEAVQRWRDEEFPAIRKQAKWSHP